MDKGRAQLGNRGAEEARELSDLGAKGRKISGSASRVKVV